MGKAEVYDAVNDVKGLFSEEFRKYVRVEKLPCHLCYNACSFACLFNQDQQPDGVDSTYLDLIYNLMMVVESSLFTGSECLAQFWRAEEQICVDDFGERRSILTTRNQPFLIMGSDFENTLSCEGICSYRMKMVDIVTGEGGGGELIGRVFQRKRVEYTPDIGLYSPEEYPHQELARSCGIKCSFAIPVSDSSGHLVGVIEVVLPSELGIYFQKQVIFEIRGGSSLRYLDHCNKDQCGQVESLHLAVSEIKEVMKKIGRSWRMVRAQTWILCNHCGSLSISKSLNCEVDASYSSEFVNPCFFSVAEYLCSLKKGEGVVGKTATSPHNLVYCRNVSKFSITEYPLAHVDRHFKLYASFAISLRSDLTGSQIYVLEFFPNGQFNGMNLRAALVPILDDMKHNFRTFKVASGEEIGDNLYVQVIDAHSPDKIVPLRNIELDLSMAIGINNIESSIDGTDDPITGASMEDTPFGSDSTVQSKCWVNFLVNHGGDLFSFQLSSSLGILDLSEQVSQSMNLKDGTYNFKYLDDDNDPILIKCDADLRLYIENSMRQEKYTLMMMIEPEKAS